MNDADISDFLEHHGIRGQKWGVRRAEPSGTNQSTQKTMSKNLKAVGIDPVALIGAAYVASILGAIAYKKISDMKAYKVSDPKLKQRMQETHTITWKKDDSLKGKMNISQLNSKVVKQVNPDYGKHKGTKTNCMRCTYAYEMRRRGYDVQSTLSWHKALSEQTNFSRNMILDPKLKPTTDFKKNPTSTLKEFIGEKNLATLSKRGEEFGLGSHEVKLDVSAKFGPKANKARAIENSKAVLDAIEKHGDGARGELGIGFGLGAHSVAWENVNGKPTVIDAQNGKIYDTPEKLADMMSIVSEAHITRLDNRNLNQAFLERWLADAHHG